MAATTTTAVTLPSTLLETASVKSSVPSTLPPSYSQHIHDELLSPPALRPRRRNSTILAMRSSRPMSTNQFHLSQMLQTLTSNEPLVLMVDNHLVYPPPPSNALYHLPRVLSWSGNEIFLSRSLPVSATRRSPASTRDLALYNIKRTPFTHEIVLTPRREGLKPAVMRGKRGLLGTMTWELRTRGEILLRYSKGRWIDSAGRVVASEKQTTSPNLNEDMSAHSLREEITIEGNGVDVWMKDLVVAAWCSRIWQSKSRTSFPRKLLLNQSMQPFQDSS